MSKNSLTASHVGMLPSMRLASLRPQPRSQPDPSGCRMLLLETYFLALKDGRHTIDLFEVRFAVDDEAVRHSKELASELRQRHFLNQPGLMFVVLDPSGRELHEEPVY